MDLIRSKRGVMAKVSRELGLTRAAVAMWQRIPAELVVRIEEITGVDRELLRPDLYRKKRRTACAARHESVQALPTDELRPELGDPPRRRHTNPRVAAPDQHLTKVP